MGNPTSQAVTPTLDALIEGLISAARAEGGFGNNRRLADIVAAAAALREYVSEDTRRLDWLETGPVTSMNVNAWPGGWTAYYGEAVSARSLRQAIDFARRASMKEQE